MLIDCDGCAVRGLACSDCVVTVLLGGPGAGAGEPAVALDSDDHRALHVLADAGLVPRLRHEPASSAATRASSLEHPRAVVRRAG